MARLGERTLARMLVRVLGPFEARSKQKTQEPLTGRTHD